MPAAQALVVVCGDLGGAPAPLCLAELERRLRREISGVLVRAVPDICQVPAGLAQAIAECGPCRVVLGCRTVSQRRAELLATLRRAGAPAAGSELVDLRPADGASEELVLEQSVVLLRAAWARVAAADLEAPVQERKSLSVGGFSRRSLLGGAGLARHPVAVWRSERCGAGVACTGCVLACPHGALRRDAGRVIVDGTCCTGCGACVAACRSGAFALPGAGLEGISASTGVLVGYLRRAEPGGGIAIACQHSLGAPLLGERWLALRVPSLQMVSSGWLLQLVATGVGARVVACADKGCEQRAAELEGFVHELGGELGFSPEGRTRHIPGEEPGAGTDVALELREPEATMRALAALGALRPERAGWRADGAGCSLGVVEVDETGCTGCGACAGACAARALTAERDGAGSLLVKLDAALCTACGACVATCPERAISLHKALDSAALTAGRRLVARQGAIACETCGAPLVSGLPTAASASSGVTHPFSAPGPGRICADCRLSGRSVSAARTC